MFRSIVCASLLLLIVAVSGCRPLLDGGWEGSANCGTDAFPISAVINETGEGNLSGVVYIEGLVFGLIARGDIDDGSFDPQENSYSFDLQTDEDELAEFVVSDLVFSDDQQTELEGDVDVLDENGQTTNTCDLGLERVDVND